jgi:hypothetical protein
MVIKDDYGCKELTVKSEIVNRVNDFNYGHKMYGLKVVRMWGLLFK